MGLWDLFEKWKGKEQAPPVEEKPAAEEEAYSGMRVEATTFDGRLLFVAKLQNLRGNTAELHQYSETELAHDEEMEPIRVNIRGYNDHLRKAVYMEGTISPLPKHIWQVEDLQVVRTGNDRAFFRLETDLEASITTFGGIGAGELPCRMLNISVGGACVRTDRRFYEQDKFLLKVKLMEDRDPSIMFCQVLRVIDKENGWFEYGCQFLELNDNDQAKITQNIFAVQRKTRTGST